MRSSSLLLLAGSSLVLTLASPLGAKTTASNGKAAVKYRIASADLLPGGDSSVDLTLMKTQLEALKRQQAELRNQRMANEAELSRIPPGSGDVARAGVLRAEIDRQRTEIDTLDTRMQMLAHRIQTQESRPPTAPDVLAGPSPAPLPLPAPTSQKKDKTGPAIPPEQITATGVRLALSPDLTVASVRSAAAEMLAQGKPGHAEIEKIDNLAILVMQQAAQSTQNDLHALLGDANGQNKKKAAQPTAAPDTKDGSNALSPEDQRRLLELQARQARVEQVLSELTPKPSAAPTEPDKSKK